MSKNKRRAAHPLNQFLYQDCELARKRALTQARDNQAMAFKKVLLALELYPAPLICEEQCLMLDGVGPKIGARISKLIYQRYAQYRLQPPQQVDSQFSLKSSEGHSQQDDSQALSLKSKPRSRRAYSPQEGSSAYIILQSVQRRHREGAKSVSKKQIKVDLKQSCQKSNLGSLKALIKHGYLNEEDDGFTVTSQGKLFLTDSKVEQAKIVKQVVLEKRQAKSLQIAPGQDCKLILLIDNREVRSQKDRNYFSQKLADDFGIQVRVESLAVGDFLWAVQVQEQIWTTGEVMQRKTVDDLSSSIIDGRYKEQKHRLIESGAQRVFYLIEGSQPSDKVMAASFSTFLDNITVIWSESMRESCLLIAELTQVVVKKVSAGCTLPLSLAQYQSRNGKSVQRMNQQLGLFLREIEGVGKQPALKLCSHFATVRDLWQTLQSLSEDKRYQLVRDLSKSKRSMSFTAIQRVVGSFSKLN